MSAHHTILLGQHYYNVKLHPVNYYITPIDEVKKLPDNATHTTVMSAYGKHAPSILNVKINGRAKTWKTRPDDVEVPIKYGMYECARVAYACGVPVDTGLYFVTIIDENGGLVK